MKNLRHQIILDIVENKYIYKQDELIIELKSRGIKVTQATLSRDLHELNIIRKTLSNKEIRYVAIRKDDLIEKYRDIFRISTLNIYAQDKFIIINTLDGRADMIGEFLDQLEDNRIAGTIARKNSILVLCRNTIFARQVFKKLESLRV